MFQEKLKLVTGDGRRGLEQLSQLAKLLDCFHVYAVPDVRRSKLAQASACLRKSTKKRFGVIGILDAQATVRNDGAEDSATPAAERAWVRERM